MAKNRAPRDKLPGNFEQRAGKPVTPTVTKGAPNSEPMPLPRRQPEAAPPEATLVSSGDLLIGPGTTVRESIWSQGKLTVGAGAVIENTVTAKTGAEIGENARIDGQLHVTGRLRWGRGASATSAKVDGALVTADGGVRATSLIAPGGIHAQSSTSLAVSR